MFLDLPAVHYHEFSTSRNEHWEYILLVPVLVLPVILDKSYYTHLLKKLFRTLNTLLTLLRNLLKCHRHSYLHSKCDLCHLVCELIIFHNRRLSILKAHCTDTFMWGNFAHDF